jgi:signal transduction histidine kinase
MTTQPSSTVSSATSSMVPPPRDMDRELLIRRLLVLHRLSLTLQTQLEEESLLRIMLSGVTAGDALGFNRAQVYLLDDSKTELAGKLGVGPINEEECRHVWSSLCEGALTFEGFLREFDQLKKYQTAELNLKTQSIRWKIGDPLDVFTRTLRDKTSYLIRREETSFFIPEPVMDILDADEIVTAPLLVTGTNLGLVVADNKFSNRPITSEDIQLLSIVANQTAAALSHIRLIRELERFHSILEDRVREAVAEKERAQTEMIRRAKLATVGEMAVTIAHEIRNPLTSVRGFAQRLHRKRSDEETVDAYSEIIIEEVDRLNRVLGDVLDFARNVDVSFGPISLNEVVESSIRLLQERFGRGSILCETDLDPNMPVCHYDGAQLTQVLINLLKNGAEAMKEGGVLVVSTHASEEHCVVEIIDTGKGISPEELGHIFEPFFTTKTKGTGLGLAFAKRVIEEHDGRIEVESEVGTGTTFRITLPVRLAPQKIDEIIGSLETVHPLVDPNNPLHTPERRRAEPE